ncbi:MAG TPA: hypothetical protein PKW90_27625, partial [Myxococcota bacterium]|nr:hypothetical protein [Myxococcota bacterium]
IGTGNAGRVQGQVDVAGTASPGRLAARLVSTGPSGQVVDSTWCETDGTFRFPEHATGDYRVEIWQGEKFRGSRAFHLEGDVSGLLVVLVEAVFQQELDLSKIGEVDSVFVDYRQNQGVHVGSRWVVQTTADSAFVVHAHVVGPPHAGKNGSW